MRRTILLVLLFLVMWSIPVGNRLVFDHYFHLPEVPLRVVEAQTILPISQSILTSTAATTGGTISLLGTGVRYHTVTWNGPAATLGVLTTCTIRLQLSYDNSTWTDITTGSCLTNGGIFIPQQQLVPYVRLTVSPRVGAGTVTAVYRGYANDPTVIQAGNSSALIAGSAGAGTSLVVAAGTSPIFVTSYDFSVSVNAATGENVSFVYGATAAACATNAWNSGDATGLTTIWGPFTAAGGGTLGAANRFNHGNGTGTIFSVPAGNALCTQQTGTHTVKGSLTYQRF